MIKKKRVTIRDVAAKAGVSATAVSFAFNAPEQLNHQTCNRIRSIAAEMNYQPHPVARTLATGRTDTIGLVIPVGLHFAMNDAFFRVFIAEFGNLCDQNRLRLLLLPIWDESTFVSVNAIAADGFLVIGINSDHPLSTSIETSEKPVVLVDSERTLNAPSFVLDDHEGAYKAMTHLLERGHRRIAVSAMRYSETKVKSTTFESRIDGYRQAVNDFGLEQSILQLVYTEERGSLLDDNTPFEDIWALPERPTAVVCVSDTRAIKIMQTAKARGLLIPNDLAIVGFDNVPEANSTSPSLTTIDQDISGRCRRAFEMLHLLVTEPTENRLDNLVYSDPVELVVRESS